MAQSSSVCRNCFRIDDSLKAAIEDLCGDLKIARIALLIDEAAHIFLPGQQRRFLLFLGFTKSLVTCNAVYPGVTYYGDTFPTFARCDSDNVDRDVTNNDYLENMREIVQKQASSQINTKIRPI
jgi:hypothetical protein